MGKISSGAQKRKKLSNEEKLMAKVPKISTFMSPPRVPSPDSTDTTVVDFTPVGLISNGSGRKPISFINVLLGSLLATNILNLA